MASGKDGGGAGGGDVFDSCVFFNFQLIKVIEITKAEN